MTFKMPSRPCALPTCVCTAQNGCTNHTDCSACCCMGVWLQQEPWQLSSLTNSEWDVWKKKKCKVKTNWISRGVESTTSWENSGLSLVGQEQTVAEAGSCSVPCKQGAQTALCSIQPCCAWVTSSTLKYNHLPYLSSLGVKACFATFVYLYFRPFSITQGNDCSFSFAKLL